MARLSKRVFPLYKSPDYKMLFQISVFIGGKKHTHKKKTTKNTNKQKKTERHRRDIMTMIARSLFSVLLLILIEFLRSLCCRFAFLKWGEDILLIYCIVFFLFIVILRVFSASSKRTTCKLHYFSN